MFAWLCVAAANEFSVFFIGTKLHILIFLHPLNIQLQSKSIAAITLSSHSISNHFIFDWSARRSLNADQSTIHFDSPLIIYQIEMENRK